MQGAKSIAVRKDTFFTPLCVLRVFAFRPPECVHIINAGVLIANIYSCRSVVNVCLEVVLSTRHLLAWCRRTMR